MVVIACTHPPFTGSGKLNLNVLVPKGPTVSAVSGPVGSWQFDADSGRLEVCKSNQLSREHSTCMIDTQRGLDPLPADASLAPLKVADAGMAKSA